ncbi:unnamed protein product, partial [marine sediment metagenome]
PKQTPVSKVEAIRNFGVDPILLSPDEFRSFQLESRWEEESYSFLNPWNDPMLIAGHGSIGLEIIDDFPDVDTVIVPIGVGGLICGVSCALKALKQSVRVIGVQSVECPHLHAAFQAGKPIWITPRETICDGLSTPFITDEMYPLLREVVDEVVLIQEKAVKAAIKRLALRNKLIVEGAGAISVACALSTPYEERGKTACIVSGGNIDTDKLIALINDPILD